MRVLSYLRMEINRIARMTPGFLEVEVFRGRGETNVYLVLSEWESHEPMRSFLMQERHVEISRGYKRSYGEGFERRRYARLHGVRKELME